MLNLGTMLSDQHLSLSKCIQTRMRLCFRVLKKNWPCHQYNPSWTRLYFMPEPRWLNVATIIRGLVPNGPLKLNAFFIRAKNSKSSYKTQRMLVLKLERAKPTFTQSQCLISHILENECGKENNHNHSRFPYRISMADIDRYDQLKICIVKSFRDQWPLGVGENQTSKENRRIWLACFLNEI